MSSTLRGPRIRRKDGIAMIHKRHHRLSYHTLVSLFLLWCCCDRSSNHVYHQDVSLLESILPRYVIFAFADSTHDNEDEHKGHIRGRQKVEEDEEPANPPAVAKIGVLPRNSTPEANKKSLNQILIHAGKRGLGGGLPGAIAGMVQVVTLMWLRTIISYQCRYGTTFRQALQTLLREGGIARLYRGLGFALIQAPLARFVSTAANDGVESFLANFELTKNWGPGKTTVVASIVVGAWRMLLMPIDTMKTVLQVDSAEGFRNLIRRVKAGKFHVLYQGSVATAVSAIVGHYPWFYTYNLLAANELVHRMIPWQLIRDAWIGLTASVVSDTVTNALRVIKTTKQSLGSKHAVSYADTVSMILAADGWKGLFGRGLTSRIYANALQSIVFTIIWRGLADKVRRKDAKQEK